MKSEHVRFLQEPSQSLSDREFVHGMWDEDESFIATDDEDSEDGNAQDEDSEEHSDGDDSEASAPSGSACEVQARRPIYKYFAKLEQKQGQQGGPLSARVS